MVATHHFWWVPSLPRALGPYITQNTYDIWGGNHHTIPFCAQIYLPKKRKKYTDDEKTENAKFALMYGIRKASKLRSVPKRTLWHHLASFGGKSLFHKLFCFRYMRRKPLHHFAHSGLKWWFGTNSWKLGNIFSLIHQEKVLIAFIGSHSPSLMSPKLAQSSGAL